MKRVHYNKIYLILSTVFFVVLGLAYILLPNNRENAHASSFDLIQTAGDSRVFFMENGFKRHIKDFNTFLSWGFSAGMIRQVSRAEFDSYPTAPQLTTVLNYNGNVYVIISGQKAWVESGEALILNGFSWSDMQTFADPTFGILPEASHLTTNGVKAVHIPSTGRVYYIENGYRRWIPNWETWYHWQFFTGPFRDVEMAKFLPEAPPLSRVLEYQGRVFAIDLGTKRYVTTAEAINLNGYSWRDLRPFAEPTFSEMPTTSDLISPKVIACAGGIYFASGGQKHHIENWDTYLSLNQQYVSVAGCGGLPDGAGITRLIQGPDGRVFWIEGGNRRYVPDPGTFAGYGFSWSSVRGVGQDVIDALPEGATMARWVAVLNGFSIPAGSGRTGKEQHIWTTANETTEVGHYALTNVPVTGVYSGISTQNGVAGTGAFGKIDPNVEKWYINMRWTYCDWYEDANVRDGDNPSTQSRNCNSANKSWHSGKKIIVSNPVTGKKLVVAIGEAGPAIWVTNSRGVISGLSPEATDYIVGASYGVGGTELEYGFAVDQTLPLGPLTW